MIASTSPYLEIEMKTIPLRDLRHKTGHWQFLFSIWDIGVQKPIDDRKRSAKNAKNQRRKKSSRATCKDI